jgi:hypothetical protein
MVQFNQLTVDEDDEDHDQDVVEDLKESTLRKVVELFEDPTVEGERFLLLSETVEQMAGNRAHLAEAVYLSKYLNRTLILPNVENSGLGIDRKYRFSMLVCSTNRGPLASSRLPHSLDRERPLFNIQVFYDNVSLPIQCRFSKQGYYSSVRRYLQHWWRTWAP